jgi:hypothetical protein
LLQREHEDEETGYPEHEREDVVVGHDEVEDVGGGFPHYTRQLTQEQLPIEQEDCD